jgi:hypothetical protein
VTKIEVFFAATPELTNPTRCHLLAQASAALRVTTLYGSATHNHLCSAIAFKKPKRNPVSIGADAAKRDQSAKSLAGQIVENKHLLCPTRSK